MTTKVLLKQYDKNLSKMWDELEDGIKNKEREDYTKLKKIKLRLFDRRNTWRLDWQANHAPLAEEGGVFDGDYANSYEVNNVADEIQTDFIFNKSSMRVIKNSCREGLKLSLIWQIIWIIDTKITDTDHILKYPVDCILIYDNKRVYTTKMRKGNGYRDFVADKDYSIEDFL
jgi:hypothetical protein